MFRMGGKNTKMAEEMVEYFKKNPDKIWVALDPKEDVVIKRADLDYYNLVIDVILERTSKLELNKDETDTFEKLKKLKERSIRWMIIQKIR